MAHPWLVTLPERDARELCLEAVERLWLDRLEAILHGSA